MAFIVELAAPAVRRGGRERVAAAAREETAREEMAAAIFCGDFLWRWQASPASHPGPEAEYSTTLGVHPGAP